MSVTFRNRVATSLLAALVLAQPSVALAADPGATANISTDGVLLNVRSAPATDKPVVGTLADHTPITVECRVWGQEIGGTQGRSPYWNRIAPGQYVSDAFVAWTPQRPEVPWCSRSGGGAVVPRVNADLLNVRSGPGLEHEVVDQLAAQSPLTVRCQKWGAEVDGPTSTAAWAELGDGRYVSAAYVSWSPEEPWLPWCGQEPPVVPGGDTEAFVLRAAGSAQESQRSHRVPASVTIAQAILETGWGRSTLAREDHNIFGMKCFGSPGPVALGCRDYATHECAAEGCWPERAQFRAYRHAADSYLDHGRQLSELSRYRVAMLHTEDPDQFAREIHKAGYATGPDYADKLIGLMRQYDLYQYDVPPV